MDQTACILVVARNPERHTALAAALAPVAGLRLVTHSLGSDETLALPVPAWAILALLADDDVGPMLQLRSVAALRAVPMLVIADGAAQAVACMQAAHGQDFETGPVEAVALAARLQKLVQDERIRRELSRKERDAALALELTRTLSSALDFREILFTVVKRIAEVVHIDRVSIVLTPEDEAGVGYVVAASDDHDVVDLRIDLARYPEIEQVVRTRDSLTIDDVANHPLLDGVRASVPRLSSISLMPILVQDHVVGVLFMRTLEDRKKLDAERLSVCALIANATGSALRSAHLMQKLRKDHRRAREAQDLAENRAEHERNVAEELRKTKEFLESLIEASVDAIVAADLHGTIILYNKGAERIYGRPPHEVVGKLHVSSLYPDGVSREVMRRIRSSDYGGVGRLESMHSAAVDKDGNLIPISLSAAMIYEHGAPTATVGIFTDLRERLQVEERLAQVQKKLEVSEKQALLAELAGTAAHELNQPLTSVMGYGELLLRRLPPGSPERNAAQVIMQESERMANLVRKIGKITRYETKSYVGDQRILDLDRAVDESAQKPEGRSHEP
jgi:PAS domain S-box-containing protein